MPSALSGRRAQAARNDEADPRVRPRGLHRRPRRADLRRRRARRRGYQRALPPLCEQGGSAPKLCADGLQRYIAAAEAALADDGDPWEAFAGFMRACVDADTNSLTQRLAGTFTPTEDLYREAGRAQGLLTALFDRTRGAGALRADLVVNDVGLVLEQVAALRIGDEERTRELRRRYLELMLTALRLSGEPLPGPPPGWEELAARWNP